MGFCLVLQSYMALWSVLVTFPVFLPIKLVWCHCATVSRGVGTVGNELSPQTFV